MGSSWATATQTPIAMTAMVATANTVRIIWWSPCEVVFFGPNRQLGQKVTGETAPLPRPVAAYPATNTGIMTLFQGRANPSPIPPTALIATTTSGGACQTARRTNPTSASAKSPGVFTALVQTGL